MDDVSDVYGPVHLSGPANYALAVAAAISEGGDGLEGGQFSVQESIGAELTRSRLWHP